MTDYSSLLVKPNNELYSNINTLKTAQPQKNQDVTSKPQSDTFTTQNKSGETSKSEKKSNVKYFVIAGAALLAAGLVFHKQIVKLFKKEQNSGLTNDVTKATDKAESDIENVINPDKVNITKGAENSGKVENNTEDIVSPPKNNINEEHGEKNPQKEEKSENTNLNNNTETATADVGGGEKPAATVENIAMESETDQINKYTQDYKSITEFISSLTKEEKDEEIKTALIAHKTGIENVFVAEVADEIKTKQKRPDLAHIENLTMGRRLLWNSKNSFFYNEDKEAQVNNVFDKVDQKYVELFKKYDIEPIDLSNHESFDEKFYKRVSPNQEDKNHKDYILSVPGEENTIFKLVKPGYLDKKTNEINKGDVLTYEFEPINVNF